MARRAQAVLTERRAADRLLTAKEAGELVDRQPATVRGWVTRGWLKRSGVNRHGAFLYHADHVLRCAEEVAARSIIPGKRA